ncbi:hypothetical protein Tco_0873647 [Tanacetum coccineum]|uniref:Reverse transcriptase domain-containing protein n=1 Tax=Tanacetum coccineum TaxID=301880 RepID=A0ABQ5BMK0_9ASTR
MLAASSGTDSRLSCAEVVAFACELSILLETIARGGTGGRAGRGGGRTRGGSGDQGDGRNDAQVGDQSRGQGVDRNQNGDAVNDHIQGDVRNAIEGNDRRGCTYKKFLACNPKEYNGKGGAIVYTRWIENIESVHDMNGCRDSQRVYKRGCKNIMGWDSNLVNVMVVHCTRQTLLCLVELWELNPSFSAAIMCMLIILVRKKGTVENSDGVQDIECIEKLEIEDLKCSGLHFTWIQDRKDPSNGILKKVDRVMRNAKFMESFVNSNVVFLPYLTSDHCLADLLENGNRYNRLISWKDKLKRMQTMVDADLTNKNLKEEEEVVTLKEYSSAVHDEEQLTTSFLININGEKHWYFKGGRGLRKEDPISPYHFTVVMEVYNLILKQNLERDNKYRYHWGCKQVTISHLCFADDLLVLCHGDSKSVKVVKKALDEFNSLTGLNPNMGKSIVFFGNLKEDVKKEISSVLPFNVGNCL